MLDDVRRISCISTNFFIRGFGNGANNAGIEPSVGVFIDGVYRSRSAAQIADLPNLQRVEVLRGPQSTLFGKNASAGVISIVTREPQFETMGSVSGTYGNYNAIRLKGDVTGPLSDSVAYSLSANYNTRDGYAKDLNTGNDINERNRWGLRGQLLFEPADDLSIRMIADYNKIDEVCCVAANVINGPTGPIINALGGQLVPEDPFSYEVYNNFDSENEVENQGISLHIDKNFGAFDLTSISAFRKVETFSQQDSDFTSADLIGFNLTEGDIETLTQEIRLTSSNTDSMVDWMIGGFYFDEKVRVNGDFQYGADFRGYADFLSGGALALVEGALMLPVGMAFGQDGQGPVENRGQDNQAWSLFGTLDFHVSDRITATVGLNYTEDEKDAFVRQTNTDIFSALDLVELGFGLSLAGLGVNPNDPAAVAAFAAANPTIFAAVVAGAQDPAQNTLLGLQPLQFLPPFLNFPNAVEDGRTKDDKLTYTFRLSADVNDNVSVYGSYATGFKATSWNLSRDSRPFPADFIPGSAVTSPPPSPIRDAGLAVNNLTTGTRFAGPEEAEVFEIGLKARVNNFAVNVAVFDQAIKGFQSNVFTGTGFALANAGKQSTKGLEFDATWNPVDQLTLVFAGTFLDPKYDSFPNSASGDLSGETPSGIPKTSTSTSFVYDFVVNNWDAYVRGDWQHSSSTPYFDSPTNQALIGIERSFDLFNASAGVTLENDITLSVWGRNIFGEEYVTTAFPSVAQGGSISGYPNQPATYGVTARKTF